MGKMGEKHRQMMEEEHLFERLHDIISPALHDAIELSNAYREIDLSDFIPCLKIDVTDQLENENVSGVKYLGIRFRSRTQIHKVHDVVYENNKVFMYVESHFHVK
tara:strand:+ start:7943 stop:8257 length:315 start_codon:yes stop_codon:yes gene_type:complete